MLNRGYMINLRHQRYSLYVVLHTDMARNYTTTVVYGWITRIKMKVVGSQESHPVFILQLDWASINRIIGSERL